MLFTVTYLCFLLLIGRAPLSIFLFMRTICDLPKNTTATNRMKIGNVREISQRGRKNKDGNSCEKFIFAKGEREKHHQVASSSSQEEKKTLTE